MQKYIHLSQRALEKHPGRKFSIDSKTSGQEITTELLQKKSHTQNSKCKSERSKGGNRKFPLHTDGILMLFMLWLCGCFF